VFNARYYADVLKSTPDIDGGDLFRYWWLFDREDVTVALFEVMGPLPPHRHPDGEHMGVFLEGGGYVLSGEEYFPVGPNDFITVHRNDAHTFYVPEGGRCVGIEITAPRCSWENMEIVFDPDELAAIEAIRRRHMEEDSAPIPVPDPSVAARLASMLGDAKAGH
jgi:mannose-6-phosphate isomerase-like protein (cupin superfamily)